MAVAGHHPPLRVSASADFVGMNRGAKFLRSANAYLQH